MAIKYKEVILPERKKIVLIAHDNKKKELLLNKLADQSFEEAAVLRDRINNLELKA